MARRDPFTIILVLLVYVVPLLAVGALLVVAGLPYLALALVVIEAVVAAYVVVARRPTRTDRRPTPRWAVPVAFVGVLLTLLAVALLAARAG